MLRIIASSILSSPIPFTKVSLSLILSIGVCFKRVRQEYSVAKSSIEIFTPSRFKSIMIFSTPTFCDKYTLSVISKFREEGGRSYFFSKPPIREFSCEFSNCRGEMFTAIEIPSMPFCCHKCNCSHALFSTQFPIISIKPVCSLKGTKTVGETMPKSLFAQCSKASTPNISPVLKLICG